MAEADEVFELIKSVILSKQGGVYLKDLNDDYKSLAGGNIPYNKLGFENVEELVSSINEIEKTVDRNGEIRFISKAKNCQHLLNLICNQKKTKYPIRKHSGKHLRKTTNFRKGHADVNFRNENLPSSETKSINYRKCNGKPFLEVGNYCRNDRNIKAEKHKSSKFSEDPSALVHKVTEYQNNKQRKYKKTVENISEYYVDQRTEFQQPASFRRREYIPEYLDLDYFHEDYLTDYDESEEDYDIKERYHWTRRDSARYSKRKVDFIGGSLLVTINNLEKH